jgi:hypothetical protein
MVNVSRMLLEHHAVPSVNFLRLRIVFLQASNRLEDLLLHVVSFLSLAVDWHNRNV